MDNAGKTLALLFAAATASAHAADAASAPQGGASAVAPSGMHCNIMPEYPPEAVRKSAQGTSVLQVSFAPDGTVASVQVIGASGPLIEHVLLDQAAASAMAHCRLDHPESAPAPRRIEYIWKLDGGDATIERLQREEIERLKLQQAQDAQLPIDAEHGIVAAQLALARQYATGERRERDDKLASMWFERAAKAGNADAQVYFGQRLMVGKGVAQDDDAGIAWLRKAAAQGNGSAAYGLGIFARAGRGMRASESDAFHWFLQGAQAGTPAAMVELADAYSKGTGTPRDDAQATRWYFAATTVSNNMYPVYRLGLAYRDGLGVPVDYERAAFCMMVAIKHPLSKPPDVMASIAPHLDAATLARVTARADAWQVGQPLFPPERAAP